MKEVHPSEIKIGDYYIQEMADNILLKRRIKGKNMNNNEIWGVYIKFLKGDWERNMHLGSDGFSFERDEHIKWYLLSEGEALLYMI